MGMWNFVLKTLNGLQGETASHYLCRKVLPLRWKSLLNRNMKYSEQATLPLARDPYEKWIHLQYCVFLCQFQVPFNKTVLATLLGYCFLLMK